MTFSQADVDWLPERLNVSAVLKLVQFARGGILAGLVTVVVMAVALLTSLTDGTSIVLYPLAAVTGVAYVLIPDRSMEYQLFGSLAFGMTALIMGLVIGFGALEVSGIVGSVVAAVVTWRQVPWRIGVPVSLLAALALVVAAANLLPLVLDGGGLGHDESAYALKARHWIDDTPETGWNDHRGIAMSGYGYLVFSAGGDEGALRLLGLVSIVGLAAATWVLGNKVGGRWVGPLSAIAVLSSPVLLRRSTEYLSDVPSAALLVGAMIVVWHQLDERERPGYGLLWLLPLAWAAFYIRYQSVLSFGLIAIMIAVLFWDKVKTGWRPIALTAIVGLVGLIPHFVFATSVRDWPLGIIFFTADVAGREFLGEGLVDYFLLMGWPLAAFVGPVAVVFFVWWLLAGWDSVRDRTECLFLMIPVVGQVLALGILSHGEARFIFFPLALTLIGGVAGFLFVRQRWRPTTSKAVSLGLAVLLVGSLAMSAAHVRETVAGRDAATDLIEAAADEMRGMSGAGSCGVMTSYFPQITYFSSCNTQFFRTHLEPEEALSRVRGEDRFLLIVEEGKNQPAGEDLTALVELTTGEPTLVRVGDDSALIYEFAP